MGTYGLTDYMCENNDHYRPRLWVSLLDQLYGRSGTVIRHNTKYSRHSHTQLSPTIYLQYSEIIFSGDDEGPSCICNVKAIYFLD